jgi:GTPase
MESCISAEFILIIIYIFMKKRTKEIKKGTKMFYLGTSDSGTMVGFTKDYFGEEGSLLPLVIREVEVLEFDFLRQKYNASRSDADGHIEYFLVEPHCLFETKEEALESAVCDISGSLKHLDWRNKKL